MENETLTILSSPGRSGMHWLKHMLASVMRKKPLEERLLEPRALEAALREKAHRYLCYEHLDIERHGFILDRATYPGLRLVLLYRHPLDILVSSFYFWATKNMLPFPERSAMENLKLFIRNDFDRTALPEHVQENWIVSMGYREYLRRLLVDWLKTGTVHGVRYEDLVSDTPGQLQTILSYCRIPHDNAALEEAIHKNRFEVLSGGRKRGEEDVTSHYRKGITEEWKTALGEEDLKILKEEIGDYLDLLGYSMDR